MSSYLLVAAAEVRHALPRAAEREMVNLQRTTAPTFDSIATLVFRRIYWLLDRQPGEMEITCVFEMRGRMFLFFVLEKRRSEISGNRS